VGFSVFPQGVMCDSTIPSRALRELDKGQSVWGRGSMPYRPQRDAGFDYTKPFNYLSILVCGYGIVPRSLAPRNVSSRILSAFSARSLAARAAKSGNPGHPESMVRATLVTGGGKP